MKRVTCLLAVALAGCGGAAGGVSPGATRIADAERARSTLAASPDVGRRAAEALAAAEGELRLAKEAESAGDSLAAELHGERAVASYQRAVILARASRAAEEETAAREALGRASEAASRLGSQRRAMDREVEDLDKQLKIAREAELPAASAAASPDREKARGVAARSLVTQARLLCGAARLVAEAAPGLPEAEATVRDLESREARGPAPIDAAARVRASCLSSLTKARRAGGSSPEAADTLLAELSQSFSAATSPRRETPTTSRDERGVVVVVPKPWKGESLSAEADASLKDLGRIAAAHPGTALQVVLHDAQVPTAEEAAADKRRLAAAARALETGGAPAARIAQEHAGARAPLVDPADAKRRDQNARLEIVFVSR